MPALQGYFLYSSNATKPTTMKKISISLLLFFPILLIAQDNLTWYEPTFVNGVCELDSQHIFHRLPARMEKEVRKPVWDLSTQSAGVFIYFKTTARSITVRYTLASKVTAHPHQPATGVSGVDLYAVDRNGDWNWTPGRFMFRDTVTYTFSNLNMPARRFTDYYLYLPPYNEVKWLSIGVPAEERFSFAKDQNGKPIVAYGTSIMQGAVASRPGLAWTNILHRKLDRTVINLGFSGNGKLEKPIFDLMAKVDAALYIIDCMPNLTGRDVTANDIKERLYYGINKLRAAHPDVPILLAEHAVAHGPFFMDTARLNTYQRPNLALQKIMEDLKADGYKNIYYLSAKDFDFNIGSTTDGLHPNDVGMMQYANAYEKIIREMLNEPVGEISTQKPVQQYREGYDWLKRHNDIIENTRKTNPDVIILANSIVHYWGGLPARGNVPAMGEESWQQNLAPLKVQNAGFGWDRIENTLWHVYHGILDEFKGRKILVKIGINNVGMNTDEEIVNGLQFLLTQIRKRKPQAEIIMAGLLPARNREERVEALNAKIKEMAMKNNFRFVDYSKAFLKDGKIDASLFLQDGLHPNKAGYDVMGREVKKVLEAK
jgi:lysophospholipase L1-like esterase